MKKLFYTLPEIFFIGFSAYWIQENYSASNSINYFAIAIIAVMVYQLISKNRVVGLAGGITLAMFSVMMMLAVRSEHNDFPKGSAEGLKFLLLGEGLFLLSFFIAGVMIFKFATQKSPVAIINHAIY